MTVETLVQVLIVGTRDAYGLTEDALTALKCMDVSDVRRDEYAFVIEGWVPLPWVGELDTILGTASRGEVAVVQVEDAPPALVDVPVALDNPRMVRPFESIVAMFSLPGKGGFDPSFLTFVTLPLFFGFMIGDFGYGLAFLGIAFAVRRRLRNPVGELASSFLLFGGLWSIVFGTVLFADFFGFTVAWGPLKYHVIDKLEDINLLLLLSLAIGVAHLNLGLAIGFGYERRRAGLKAAFLKKISWVVLEVGLGVSALGFLGYLAAPHSIVGLSLLAVALALLGLGGGFVDVLEIPHFIGSLLSYLRLGIVGVSKGALALAVNTVVVEQLIPLGAPGLVLGGVVLVIGHAAIMALAVLTVGVHALRLHYVEFYTKFYPMEEIGIPRPFRPTERLPEPPEAAA